MVGLYDPARKQLIWRGDASKTVDLKKDPNKNFRISKKRWSSFSKTIRLSPVNRCEGRKNNLRYANWTRPLRQPAGPTELSLCVSYLSRSSKRTIYHFEVHLQKLLAGRMHYCPDVTPSTVERCRVFSFETGALSASFRAAQQLPADQQRPILFLSKWI